MFVGDSLTTAFGYVRSMLGFRGGLAPADLALSNEAGLQAYLSSGLLRKVIRIPAADRTSKWRDWQADSDAIGKIEAEERRLGLRAKVKQAEILRGLGGGALILVTAGVHSTPLNPASLGERGLIAVNVVSRWQLTCKDWDEDLASPTYGQPRMFEVRSNRGTNTQIHPSRVITFRGDPLPASGCVSMEQAFWGDSRLAAVLREVYRSDEVNGWFAALVRKAKLTRYGIPNLSEMLAAPGGQERLNKRVATIAEGENIMNAVVFQSAGGTDQPGEQITDYQVNWSGIPAVMDAFDQRVAAVADIPFTRLMGRSPAGMNATGQHDMDNWWAAVSDGQENELRPCLESLDPVLLASAGVPADGVTWTFAPLSTPSEKEAADTFKTTMEALTALRAMEIMPEEAFNEAAQNLLLENETLPGLEQILADIPEDERFGVDPAMDPSLGDPSAINSPDNGGKEVDPTSPTARGASATGAPARAANDAKPIPLYVQRKLLNAGELIAWAKKQGFTSTLPADDMHVTVLYSRTPVDPIKMGETWSGDDKGNLTIKPGGPRAIEKLGESAVVLLFASSDLVWRHQSMVEAGASHDYPEYQPHVTLTYEAGDVDLEAIKPFSGKLVFGPEIFEPLDLDWKQKVTEE